MIAKRGLYADKNRPTYWQKEICMLTKRNVHADQKRPACWQERPVHTEFDSYCYMVDWKYVKRDIGRKRMSKETYTPTKKMNKHMKRLIYWLVYWMVYWRDVKRDINEKTMSKEMYIVTCTDQIEVYTHKKGSYVEWCIEKISKVTRGEKRWHGEKTDIKECCISMCWHTVTPPCVDIL